MDLVGTVARVDIAADADTEFGPFDYADAFEARTARRDARPAVSWLRAGLEDSPAALRWLIVLVHRHVLRFRPGPHPGAHMLSVWRIVKLEDDDARLEADGPLITGRLVATRRDPHTVRLETFVTYNRRPVAQVVWTVVGPLHRWAAPYLMKRAAQGSRVAAE